MASTPQTEPATPATEAAKPRHLTLPQRLLIWLVSNLAAVVIFLIGMTMRWRVEMEEGGEPDLSNPNIYCFWHECIFALAWRYSCRGMAVVTSRSHDGEFIAQTIEKLGYTAVRGSSSRGGVGALLGMHDAIERGKIAIFTIDGPRGPRHVAKPGPILLAKNTQRPVYCMYAAVERKWRLKSWDKMMIPKPFTRAYARVANPIHVPPDADDATIEKLQAEMQASLERVTEYAEAKFLPPAVRVRTSVD